MRGARAAGMLSSASDSLNGLYSFCETPETFFLFLGGLCVGHVSFSMISSE